jgi:hypothetical protein
VSVTQPQLPQLAALRIAAEAGAKSVPANTGIGAAGLVPAILSKSM